MTTEHRDLLIRDMERRAHAEKGILLSELQAITITYFLLRTHDLLQAALAAACEELAAACEELADADGGEPEDWRATMMQRAEEAVATQGG